MSFKKYDVNPEFAHLFEFTSEEEALKHRAKILMFKFLSEIERITEGKLFKKDYAEYLGITPSFVTQLFKGDKLINLTTLAKLEDTFDIDFDVKARPNEVNSFEIEVQSRNITQEQVIPLYKAVEPETSFSMTLVRGLFLKQA